MKNADVMKLVEQLAESLVFMNPGDPETFADLPEKVGDLAAAIMEAGHEEEAAICRSAIGLASQLISGDLEWEYGLDTLSRTLNALQACLHQECPLEDAGFPSLLFEEASSADAGSDAQPETSEADVVESEDEPEATGAPVEAEPPAAEADSDTGSNCSSLVDDAIMSEFLSRQADILQDVEKMLLNMDEDPASGDIEGLLRFFHTLKGESALLGMSNVAELCHATEDMMQKEDPGACVDRLLDVKDWFIATFKHLSEEGPEPDPLSKMLARLEEQPAAAAEPAEEAPSQLAEVASEDDPDEAIAADEDQPEIEAASDEAAAEPEADPVAADESAESAETATPAPVDVELYEVVDYSTLNVLAGDVDLVQDFVEEAVEHLDASEADLLTIESDPKDSEALNSVFRGFHTIKGLAGFVELEHVKDLAHKAENLLDMARRDELDLVGLNMDLVFESVDMMKRLIVAVADAMGGDGYLPTEAALPRLMTNLVAVTSGEPAPQVIPRSSSSDRSQPEARTEEAAAPEPPAAPADEVEGQERSGPAGAQEDQRLHSPEQYEGRAQARSQGTCRSRAARRAARRTARGEVRAGRRQDGRDAGRYRAGQGQGAGEDEGSRARGCRASGPPDRNNRRAGDRRVHGHPVR